MPGSVTEKRAAGRARRFLIGNPGFLRWQERVTGVILIGLGARLALQER